MMKKGLRLLAVGDAEADSSLNIFPDEEGIKTQLKMRLLICSCLNIFPDEEGIKTSSTARMVMSAGPITIP